MWDPTVYHRFGDERSRPFHDLVARIGAERPRAVADLGCGPGELTAGLARRWPDARVTGLDSSPEMIGKARALAAPVAFDVADVHDWQPAPDTDVVVTNAVLQWVPEHRALIERWVRALPSGAWFAMQVPGNFDAPSHRALRALARSAPYAETVGEIVREAPVDDAAGYAALLTGAGATVDAWETTYVHLLAATGPEHPVLRWMEGTALRPVKAALAEPAWRGFRAALGATLAAEYPARNGYVAFPFRRIFTVATIA
ncbi:trans-aconitate 2-methyltransferase [Actinoplanes sp. ATCC 53533]|uniref:trans-aconitate 2-methyltransferase n=1 Tax=Actinoplanes sp. ATCC 53533 TaxID=1288362 RepID=UPI000F78554F|nr:trans-aconitate 2-methyltransferase [Actinoplanes sp. ATCC 53533]RSM60368.1 trans-aconitate 2-methyltransferase [Actinoplanes sp. ATCC 53533]